MLDGKTAIVSGSSSGIGRAVAETFGREGADVAISYCSNEEGATAAAESVREAGGDAVVFGGDLGDRETCREFVERAREALGPIDVLVNNVGIVERKPFEDLGDEEWKQLLDVNLDSCFRLSRLVMPAMAERGEGAVVNVSSIWAHSGTTERVPYGASKGAITSMTRHLSREYGPEGVRVNAVSPGPIETPMNESSITDEEAYERVASSVPLGRWGQPEEVAELVAFLVGPKANYIHGEDIIIDGGRTV